MSHKLCEIELWPFHGLNTLASIHCASKYRLPSVNIPTTYTCSSYVEVTYVTHKKHICKNNWFKCTSHMTRDRPIHIHDLYIRNSDSECGSERTPGRDCGCPGCVVTSCALIFGHWNEHGRNWLDRLEVGSRVWSLIISWKGQGPRVHLRLYSKLRQPRLTP